ncbi:MAG: phospholipase D family protein [Gammaproteobacteria bacterium]|nr:phospholipase D family protein [Gammaproteobacteria bacterium]
MMIPLSIVAESDWPDRLENLTQEHKGQTGVYLLEKGEDALLSRAWLADTAKHSIDVQYFIWSTDNIGTLAAASLLRAAKRGVHVRVLVDDLLIDASNDVLYALASHPNVEIRIYNPKLNVGQSFFSQIINVAVDFRGINQRMHNKVFIVDQQVVITGGRNMADEYFDYDQKYNFRDRDVLLVGEAVKSAVKSFVNFWDSQYAVAIEELIQNPFERYVEKDIDDEWGDTQEKDLNLVIKQVDELTKEKIDKVYQYLAEYELDMENFIPEMRVKVKQISQEFSNIVNQLFWTEVDFISDLPGKNDRIFTLGGGSQLTDKLAEIVNSAKQTITIQSPYLVMSWDAWDIFRQAVKRGVRVRINTNSLSSTDNLPAYSGYSRQRNRLLNTGIEIYEFRPDARIRMDIINRYEEIKTKPPVFAVHAKTMIVDGQIAYIGSFNFDPRSENLNTEAGVIIRDKTLARRLESIIEVDMQPENSWNVKVDGYGHNASFVKKTKVFILKLIPMDSIL